ncbi:hypothetical protein HPB50_008607 [Hyalomma asiaticum]|uniref:Uncharacterized protein n=1 Tax=Hyalomma asiaticum TaxID=266040 RepID=A0ACB7RZ71_HYAAI|nr:hypothetical protein HPB50_008607 [Hyalomma asiaticum]
MNEELRIRSSAESIRRRMSAIHSRKVRVVLASGVLCIFVGLGALAAVVKKPDVLHVALAFFGVPSHVNGTSAVLGPPEPGKSLVDGSSGTTLFSSPVTTTSDSASSSVTAVRTTFYPSPPNASAVPDTTLPSSSTAITVERSSKVVSPGSDISGTPTTTTAVVGTSQEVRAMSLNATGVTVAAIIAEHASQKSTPSGLDTATFKSSSSPLSQSSRKVSATSSIAPKTAFLVVDHGGPKEMMQMWPHPMREVESPASEEGDVAVPFVSKKAGSDEPLGGSKLWYYIGSTGGNSTSDDVDDEVFGEGDNTESPLPPRL